MKNKFILSLALACTVLAAGCENSPDAESSGVSSDNHPTIPSQEEVVPEIEPVELNDHLLKAYDAKNVKQYDKLKTYHCSLTQLNKDNFLSLFSTTPVQNERGGYTTDTESGSLNVCGSDKPGVNGVGEKSFHSLLTYSKESAGFYGSALKYFDNETTKNALEKELSFLSRAEVEQKAKELWAKFSSADIEFEIYGVSAEDYSAAIKKEPGIEWGEARDYYVVEGYMTVDGVRVAHYNSYDGFDNVNMPNTKFTAMFNSDGLWDFTLQSPWDLGEIKSEDNLISLEEAENIIAEQFPVQGMYVSGSKTLYGAGIYYRADYTSDGLYMVPYWGFYTQNGDLYVSVNAATGEMVT